MVKEGFDLVILGAGVTGASAAYWAKKLDPNLKILILDKGNEKAASRLNAGFITSGSLNFYNDLLEKKGISNAEDIWLASKRNIKLVEQTILENDFNVDFIAGGSYSIIKKGSSFSKNEYFKKSSSFIKFENYDVFYDKSERSFSPSKFLSLLHENLKQSGVVFNEFKASSIEQLRKNFNFKNLLIATNNSDLLKHEFKITPQRAQAAEFSVSSPLPCGNFYFSPAKIYFRKFKNKIVIGGLRQLDFKSEQTSSMVLNSIIQQGLKDFVTEYIDLNCKFERAWSGIMGFSPSGLPVYGQVAPAIHFLGGHSGHGNGFAFVLSKEIVESLFDEKEPIFLPIFNKS